MLNYLPSEPVAKIFVLKGLSLISQTGAVCPLKCFAPSPSLPFAAGSKTATPVPLNDEEAY
jgi:hypothetical protein